MMKWHVATYKPRPEHDTGINLGVRWELWCNATLSFCYIIWPSGSRMIVRVN